MKITLYRKVNPGNYCLTFANEIGGKFYLIDVYKNYPDVATIEKHHSGVGYNITGECLVFETALEMGRARRGIIDRGTDLVYSLRREHFELNRRKALNEDRRIPLTALELKKPWQYGQDEIFLGVRAFEYLAGIYVFFTLYLKYSSSTIEVPYYKLRQRSAKLLDRVDILLSMVPDEVLKEVYLSDPP